MKKIKSQEQKIIDSLLSRSLEIECSKIILTSQNEDDAHVYEGPGRLISTQGGGVEVRVHWHGEALDAFPKTSGEACNSLSYGKVIPRSAYYALEAFDLVGRIWRGFDVWVDINLYVPSMAGILLGSVSEIQAESEITESQGNESITYFKTIVCIADGFEFPCNSFTDFGVEGSSRNVSKFDIVGNMACKVVIDEKHVTIVMLSPSPIPEPASQSLLAALEIIAGIRLTKTYTRERSESHLVTTISPVGERRRLARLPGPFDHHSPTSLENVVTFIRSVVESSSNFLLFHQLWRDIFFARQAGAVAFGLSASVAVEGVLKHYFRAYMAADADFSTLCREVIPFVLRLPEYTKDEFFIDPDSFARILKKVTDNLQGADQISVKNALHKLFPDLANDWIKLRNPAAHGGLYLSPPDAQVLHDRTFSCLHIYYVMLLAYLSFEGEFIDYSRAGYPRTAFSSVNPISSEAAHP